MKAVPLPTIFHSDSTNQISSTLTRVICKTIGPDFVLFQNFCLSTRNKISNERKLMVYYITQGALPDPQQKEKSTSHTHTVLTHTTTQSLPLQINSLSKKVIVFDFQTIKNRSVIMTTEEVKAEKPAPPAEKKKEAVDGAKVSITVGYIKVGNQLFRRYPYFQNEF